ncbi:TonB-dependent receptor [Dyella dinghuensis]|uniref:TonB-dependent receptor n=1 Tax=Dyella dinghuensis TaxID=1920169 RepID=UPI001F25A0F2|nr:TonB-dependent receptor [Dyella dinghuensis]
MIGKKQSLPWQQRRTNPLSAASLSSVRLASAIALGLALTYAPGALHAQDANQTTTAPAPQTNATGQAANNSKPADKTKAKTKDQKDVQDLDGVTVTGIRASLQTSQSLKQNASQIVDSVTATDINALPDRSVTETLQRISGVTVDHYLADDDPDHPSAEGSAVLIRGLPYVASLLNGGESFSANNGRALSFEDVPAELMEGVDVYKNPSAEMIEGGIGGTVDLRTRQPFDSPGQVIGFSTGVNEGDMEKKSKPSSSFLYSNRWKTENLGEFGALLDVSYSELASRSDGVQVNPYVLEPADNLGNCGNVPCEPTSANGNVAIPGDINYYQMDMQRRRTGLYGALQWRPTNDLEISTRLFRSIYNLQWVEHEVQANEGNYFNMVPVPGTTFDYNGNGVFQDGDMVANSWQGYDPTAKATLNTGYPPIGGPNYYALTREQTQFTRTTDWSTDFKYNLNDHMIWSGAVQFVKSTSNEVDFTVYNQFFMPPANVNVSGTPGMTLLPNPTYATIPSNTTNPNSLTNYSNYYLGAALDHLEYDYAMERAFRTDLEYDFVDNNWLQYVKVGVRATTHDTYSNNNSSSYNWGPISQVWQGSSIYNGGTQPLDWANNVPAWMEQQFTMSDFFRGQAKVPTTLIFPSTALVGNYYGAISSLRALELDGGAGGWCPQFFTSADGCTPASGMSADYMHESTQAGYAMLYFGNDNALGIPFDGNIGVRFVRTSLNANGSVTYPSSDAIQNPTGITPAQMALFNGMTTPINGAYDYHNVLPSLNLRFKLTDDLQLRLAASKGITRPDISELNSYMVIGSSWTSAGTSSTSQSAKLAGFTATSGGNPDLKPLEANQFDAALEWYFAPTSELYVTLFKKDLSNYTTTEVHQQIIDGVPVAVSGPTNAGKGTIKGAEFGYSQFFDFLPGAFKGLGVQANYTFLQSSKVYNTTSCDPNHGNGSCSANDVVTNPGLPMQGLSPHNYNITGMYESGDWSARLAWSWRSRYLITPVDSGDTYLPMWNASSGQLDGSVFYHLNKNMQVGLQVNNITNTVQRVLMGPTSYVNGYVDWNLYTRALFMTDRRYELVFRASF